ncbi:hypothetical protein [Mycobacterium sp. 236(2023)]|uniref:hypothetical protein n=1 Tax=Mycobacterium sp. 236(2023) TaxID=3038163 RepID=UPI002414D3BC|nr:hypothetical protein [Mycobacterium sp. 236(2023)]MDG4669459.1 hypothetical protein [Mycobacterium sp. 236(2023)]
MWDVLDLGAEVGGQLLVELPSAALAEPRTAGIADDIVLDVASALGGEMPRDEHLHVRLLHALQPSGSSADAVCIRPAQRIA